MSHQSDWTKLIPFLILSFGLFTCSDPTAIGTDLLEQDLVEVSFTDTIPITSKTVRSDRIATFDQPIQLNFFTIETFNQLSTYLFGNFDDPVFGQTEASIYIQPEKASVEGPDFSNSTLDSIVLVLPFANTAFYGDSSQSLEMEVYRLTELPDNETIYYSDSEFLVEEEPIASQVFTPLFDTISVDVPITGADSITSVEFGPQLRIRLPDALGQELLELDPVNYESDTAFFDYFKGLYLKPKGASNNMVAFRLGRNSVGSMEVYYNQLDPVTNEDTIRIYQFGFFYTDAVRFVNVKHNYETSIVGKFIDSTSTSDDFVFVQGAGGSLGKIEFPNLSALEDVVINKAELEINLALFPGDDTMKYQPIEQLSLYQVLEDGTIEPLEDLNIVLLAGRSLTSTFGGNLTESTEVEPHKYTFNITAALQDMLDNNIKPEILVSGLSSEVRAASVNAIAPAFSNDIVNSAFSSIERANRSVFFGANHPDFPIKLNVTFSRP